jgi:hypothetical protein
MVTLFLFDLKQQGLSPHTQGLRAASFKGYVVQQQQARVRTVEKSGHELSEEERGRVKNSTRC